MPTRVNDEHWQDKQMEQEQVSLQKERWGFAANLEAFNLAMCEHRIYKGIKGQS